MRECWTGHPGGLELIYCDDKSADGERTPNRQLKRVENQFPLRQEDEVCIVFEFTFCENDQM